jgi:hypothetical protein
MALGVLRFGWLFMPGPGTVVCCHSRDAGGLDRGKHMKRTARILTLMAAALAVGCSNNNSLMPTVATATFTGAVSGTANVVAVGSTYSGNTGVNFSIGGEGTFPALSFLAKIMGGSLQTGTFTNTSSSAISAITVVQQTNASGPVWEQEFIAGGVQTGSFTLTISSTGGSTTQNGTTVWSNPQGTMNAVLPALPGGGATGTVNVSVTF